MTFLSLCWILLIDPDGDDGIGIVPPSRLEFLFDAVAPFKIVAAYQMIEAVNVGDTHRNVAAVQQINCLFFGKSHHVWHRRPDAGGKHNVKVFLRIILFFS